MGVPDPVVSLPGTGPAVTRVPSAVPRRGTVVATVVFCDVVNSTATMTAIGDVAADRLRSDLYGLLRGAVAERGGETVKTLGDGILAVFLTSAVQGVDAAVALHAAAEGVVPPQVLRVGVATGEVAFDDDDVHGQPVVEAARLCALAGPGTTLLTDVTRRVVGSRSEHAIVAEGPRVLRGMPEPVDVHRIGGVPLPQRVPDPKPRDGPRARRRRRRRIVGAVATGAVLVAATAALSARRSDDESSTTSATSTPAPSVGPTATTPATQRSPDPPPSTVPGEDLGYTPQLRSRTCETGESGGDDSVTCWMLVVPMDRSNPAGLQVELPVVRAPATDRAGTGVPTVLLGPESNEPLGATVAGSELRLVTEQISMVQRGQREGTPSLDCPETDVGRPARLASPSDQAEEALDGVLEQCRMRLVAEGVRFDRFGADDVADDLRDLAVALGVPQIDVRAVFDDGHVLSAVLRRHPDVVRAAMVIAPVAVSPATTATFAFDDAWRRYVEQCRAQPTCAPQADRLDARLDDLLELARSAPPVVPVTGLDGAAADVLVDPARVAAVLAIALQDPVAWPLIAAQMLAEDALTIAAAFLASVLPANGEARSLLESVRRCDDGPTSPGDLVLAAAASERWGALIDVDLYERCARFELDVTVEDVALPPTQVPILVIGAELDPLSPPDAVRRMFSAARNTTTLVLPDRNYRGRDWLPCVDDLRAAFLADPTAPLVGVDECAASHPPIELIPPDTP